MLPFRLVAALLLALSVSAQLGTLAHLALVPHVRCAEHGTVEHRDAGHAEHAEHHAASVDVDEPGEHGHDCDALALLVVAAPNVLDAPVHALPGAHLLPPPCAPSAPELASRALDDAPKTSPPA